MRLNNSFLVGIAVGIGVGYYLATEDKDELIEQVKDKAGKARDMVEDGIEKGKRIADNIKSKVKDYNNE